MNDVPVAVNDAISVNEDASVSASVAGNDTPSGDGGNVWTVVTTTSNGTLVFNADGSYTYTPNANFNGTDVFTYTICDVDGDCSTATVTITINPVDDAPVAVNDTNTTNQGIAVSGNASPNDTPSGDGGNTWTLVGVNGGAMHGTVTMNSNGTYTYTPTANYNGTDVFTYQVCDVDGDCSTATITITIWCIQTEMPSLQIQQPTCSIETGTITVTVPLGPGLMYSINGSAYQVSTTFNNVMPGTYYVTVKNGSCISIATTAVINLKPAGPVAPAVTITQPTCTVNTGTITVTAPTGTGYLYSVNGTSYQSSAVFSGLAMGVSYNVTVKNAVNCISSPTVAVLVSASTPSAPILSVVQPTCNLATGTITVTTPTGAALSYSKNGSTYQSSPVFSGLTAGSYTIRVKNGLCVSAATSATITAQPAKPATPSVTITQPTCTIATGTITVTSPTGTGLTYSINGTTYQSNTVFSGLTGGVTYNVTARNAAGCISVIKTALVNAQPITPATPVMTVTQPTCAVATGSISVTAPIGLGYTYSKDGVNYQTSNIFPAIAAGSYTIRVKNGLCVSSGVIAVINSQPATPATPGLTITQPTCSISTGTITITAPVSAGLLYSVNGVNYQSSTVFNGLAAGITYNVTVRNTAGCISKATTAVINPQPVTPAAPALSLTQPSCFSSTGSITVSSPVGTGYTYSINGTTYQSGTTFTGLVPGSYTVKVKNSAGCISAGTVAVLISSSAVCSAGIYHTTVDCNMYKTAADNQKVAQINYTAYANAVNTNTTPGQFFYYMGVTAPSSSFCVDVIQTKSCSSISYFAINQTNQIILWNASCVKVVTGTEVSAGHGRICITGAVAGTKYVLSVKYDTKSIVGSTFAGDPPTCQYNFESRINGTLINGSASSIFLVPISTVTSLRATKTNVPTSLEQQADEARLNVSATPNPSSDRFRLHVTSASKELIRVRIVDLFGRMKGEIKIQPNQTVFFGNDLKPGMYVVEVNQGTKREVIKVQKL